ELVGDGPEMFVAMVEVEPTARLWETVFGDDPDPGGPVGNDEHVLGLSQPAVDGLTVQLSGQGFDPQTGADIAALADDGPAPRRLRSVIESEDGADIDPVPLGRHLLVLAQGFQPNLFGVAPVIALADVPGVDLDDEGKGRTRRPFLLGGQFLDRLPG